MNCHEFERLLDRIVEGAAPEQTRRDAARHRGACAACRELEEMARASLDARGAPGQDLTRAVMSLTSGSACGAAGERLAGLMDGALADAERELVLLHLEDCAACEELAATMRWMSGRLPSLAEIDPRAGFTEAVMRRTARRPTRTGLAALKDRWAALMARPRFTWEAAYVGALVVWLLFGAGFAPFNDVPGRALELARINPILALEDRVQPASLGRQAWEVTGGRVLEKAEGSTSRLSDRTKRLRVASGSLAAHGTEMLGSALRGDLSSAAVRLEDMGADLRVIWDEIRRRGTGKNLKSQEA